MQNALTLLIIQNNEGCKSTTLTDKMRAYVPSVANGCHDIRSVKSMDSFYNLDHYGSYNGKVSGIDGRGDGKSSWVVEFPTQLGLAYRYMFHKDGLKMISPSGSVIGAGAFAKQQNWLNFEEVALVAKPYSSQRDFAVYEVPLKTSGGEALGVPLIRDFDNVVTVVDGVLNFISKYIVKLKFYDNAVQSLVLSWAFASMKSYFVPAFLLLKSNDFTFFANDVGESDDGFLDMKEALSKPGGLKRMLSDYDDVKGRRLVYDELAKVKDARIFIDKIIGICSSINLDDCKKMGLLSGILGVLSSAQLIDEENLYDTYSTNYQKGDGTNPDNSVYSLFV